MKHEGEEITLKQQFDGVFDDTKIDKTLIDRIYKYQIGYVNKNSEHLAFFGSNLIGVHAIRWRTSDTVQFCSQVLRLDFSQVEREVRKATTIVHEFKIGGDVFNLLLMYVMHRILTSPYLTATQRKRGAYDTALVFFYRCIAIRQSEYFPHPADEATARAAYARLSNKFLLKRVGNWKRFMEYRAEKLLSPDKVHYQPLVAFNDDIAIVYAVNDSVNRIKDAFKNMTAEFYESHGAGERIGTVSATVIDVEGVEKLKEKVKSVDQYVSYLRNTIMDTPSFVKPELVAVIVSINTNTSNRMLTTTLTWLSDQYGDPKWSKKIDEFISLVVIHSFHLLGEMDARGSRDYPTLLLGLKNLYLSTRSTDPELLRLRKLGEELIKAANGRVNSSLAMATRTSVILYVTLRALTINMTR